MAQTIDTGDYVIVRCTQAGVHAGRLQKKAGAQVSLSAARRLWYWKPLKGAFLSGVAEHGLHADSKVGTAVTIELLDACEVILCSPAAAASIQAHNPHLE